MMKNTPKKSGNFTPSQVGVLIEEMDKRYQLLAEGQSGLNRKFDGLNQKFDGLCVNQARTLESITQIRFDVKKINRRLDSLESARA